MATVAATTSTIAATSPAVTSRYENIDLLRGLVMTFMAIDHFRDYFAPVADPMDLAAVSPLLFVFRLLAHFCAPVFAFLMGASAWISSRHRQGPDTSRQLLLRGLLLIALEFTLVDWAWNFNPLWPRKFFQVIAALGCGCIALALFTRLKHHWALITGLAIVFLHNLADGIGFASNTAPGTAAHYLWSFLHQRNVLPLVGNWEVRTSYPVLPIIGVSLLGYALAPLITSADARARRRLIQLGLACCALFLALRLNILPLIGDYGDASRFTPQPTALSTLFAVFNTTKYPLSLQFTLMTLGPALIALALWRHPCEPFTTLGRVPMFYYLTHIATIHAAVLAMGLVAGHPLSSTRFGFVPDAFTLPVWTFAPLAAAVVAALYPLCRRYDALRRSKRFPWLAYL